MEESANNLNVQSTQPTIPAQTTQPAQPNAPHRSARSARSTTKYRADEIECIKHFKSVLEGFVYPARNRILEYLVQITRDSQNSQYSDVLPFTYIQPSTIVYQSPRTQSDPRANRQFAKELASTGTSSAHAIEQAQDLDIKDPAVEQSGPTTIHLPIPPPRKVPKY